MRKLCRKVVVEAIEPMDADTLEAARVGGWRVVVRKGEFSVGDTALYFEVDSALNPHDDRYAFLKERCYKRFLLYGKPWDECIRIRTMKLRGVVSQGLLLPVDQFCEVRNIPVGEDCSAVLAVRHYDEVAERVLQLTGSVPAPNRKADFPSFVPKTDEERVQNLDQETLDRYADVSLEVTEKKDGSSATYWYSMDNRPDDPFGVCSRNMELKDTDECPWWTTARQLDMAGKLRAWFEAHGEELAVQGEITGPGINRNRDTAENLEFHVFRIWNITLQRYLTWEERYRACHDMGLAHVPVIGYWKIREYACDRDSMLRAAEGSTARGNEREGLVWKSNDGTFSFKTVSNRYLLKMKE